MPKLTAESTWNFEMWCISSVFFPGCNIYRLFWQTAPPLVVPMIALSLFLSLNIVYNYKLNWSPGQGQLCGTVCQTVKSLFWNMRAVTFVATSCILCMFSFCEGRKIMGMVRLVTWNAYIFHGCDMQDWVSFVGAVEMLRVYAWIVARGFF
jgi:hypothetical protein